MPIPALQDADLDALAKACKIGMERAATALSQLLGKGVDIEIPRLRSLDTAGGFPLPNPPPLGEGTIGSSLGAEKTSSLLEVEKTGSSPQRGEVGRGEVFQLPAAEEFVGLHLQILGEVRGDILIVLREASALGMLRLLLGSDATQGSTFSELEASTLKEVGNILASACLNALGTSLGMMLLPSVPSLALGKADAALARVMEQPADGEPKVVIEAHFSSAEPLCDGTIFLVPSSASLLPMLTALGIR